MKFWVPAIALFCLARDATSDRSGNALVNEPAKLLDSHDKYDEPFKHHKRLVRNKGLNLKLSHYRESNDIESTKSNIHEDERGHFKTRRKSEVDVVQQAESNSTSEAKKANLTHLFNDPELMLKSLVTERRMLSSAAEEDVSEVTTVKRKRYHHGKLAGRAKASCDSCNGPTECPSNLENMFVCPKCRTHFVVKIHIKESKGCEP